MTQTFTGTDYYDANWQESLAPDETLALEIAGKNHFRGAHQQTTTLPPVRVERAETVTVGRELCFYAGGKTRCHRCYDCREAKL